MSDYELEKFFAHNGGVNSDVEPEFNAPLTSAPKANSSTNVNNEEYLNNIEDESIYKNQPTNGFLNKIKDLPTYMFGSTSNTSNKDKEYLEEIKFENKL